MKTFGVGRFVTTPELVTIGDTVKSNFSLVWNEVNKFSSETKKTPHFLDFEVWDSAAKFICNNCQKGDKIYVEAIPRQTKWDKDGQKRQKIVFRVERFEIFVFGKDNENTPSE